jgi:hypothetical protein
LFTSDFAQTAPALIVGAAPTAEAEIAEATKIDPAKIYNALCVTFKFNFFIKFSLQLF